MTNSAAILSHLISDTLDGDWGKSDKIDGSVACRVIRGADFPSVRLGILSDVPIRYLSNNSLERRSLRTDDIIIETAGGAPGRPTGRTILVTERICTASEIPLTCASFCRFLRIDPSNADPRYVFWYLQYLYAKGEMWAHQVQHTGLARFQYTRFANSVEIPLPQKSVQHAIARVLGAHEDKIALNHHLNQILGEIGEAIFEHWFSDFEFPNEEGKPYKTSDGEMTYNEELEMDIPKGWEAAELGEVMELTMGLSPKGESYNTKGEGIPLINGAADFSEEGIIPKKFTTQPTRMCSAGDLLFCIRGTIGNLTYADKPYCLGRGVAAITTSDRVYKEYVYFALKQKISFMTSQAAGSVIVGISKPDIMNLRILLAPKIIVSKFQAIVENVFARKETNKIETHDLSRIRDSLLPKLMSGTIKVRAGVE